MNPTIGNFARLRRVLGGVALAASACLLAACVEEPLPPIGDPGTTTTTTSTTTTTVPTGPVASVVINEVVSSGGEPDDWVELYNTGNDVVDLGGYVMKDDNDERTDTLPSPTLIAPGEFLVLDYDVHFSFGLGGNDAFRLYNTDGQLVASYEWEAHAPTSYGRCPDGTGELQITTAMTKGEPNNCVPIEIPESSIRITEWMYSGAVGEFIELTNIGTEPVDMTGWSYDDDGATPGAFDLSELGVVAAGESVLLSELTSFDLKNEWNLCAGIKVVGPYVNKLGRSDQINIFDASGELADRLTYGDNVIDGSPRTQNISAYATADALGADDATLWVLSEVGDAEGSFESVWGDIANPGSSSQATVAFDPCAAAD